MTDRQTLSENHEQGSPASRVRVWDPLVRLFHWSLVTCFAVAFVTEDDLLTLHVWAGYAVFGLIGVRLLWGFVGPRYARWTDFVKTPGEIANYLGDSLRFRSKRHLGHNPAGGAMILAMLVSLVVTGASGLAVYGAQELSGPLAGLLAGLPDSSGHMLEEVHEAFANLTLMLVVLHLGGVALSSFQHRENLVKAMVTGYKRG